MNYYEILRVPSTATLIEIKKAYKKLAKRYHPDVYDGNKVFAEYKIKEINAAYEVLKTKKTKDEYDAELKYKKYEAAKSDFVKTKTKYDYEKYQNAYNVNAKHKVKTKQQSNVKSTFKISIDSLIIKYFSKLESGFRTEEKQDFIIFLLTSLIVIFSIAIITFLI